MTKPALVGHLLRTYRRYQADRIDRLAAAVTFYWFLSLFPILLLVLAAYGYLHAHDTAAQLNTRLGRALGGFLPPPTVKTLTDTLATAKGKAGIIGLIGLLLSGLGWIDALRETLRTVWHLPPIEENVVVRKLVDVVVLVGLFASLAASSFVTGLASSGPQYVLSALSVDKTTAAKLFLKLVALLLGGVVDLVLFLYLFKGLAQVPGSLRRLLSGAIFGAVGFALLKVVGGFYVQHTTTKGQATYGTFAVVVGLLLFLNLVSRLILLSAAFVVSTDPDPETPAVDDVEPAGTPAFVVPPGGGVSPAEVKKVRVAARATAGVGALVVGAVTVYAAKTARVLVRK